MSPAVHLWPRAAVAAALAVAASACSVERFAVNRLGDALAGGTSAYATDDDPDLVRGAIPFGLKTIEGLLLETPRHRGLLLAAASGFTQYAYAFVQFDADLVEDTDLAQAAALRARAGKLYLRAAGYGFRGLEVAHPGLRARLLSGDEGALDAIRGDDVPLLYWTAAALGAAIGLDPLNTDLSADLPVVTAMMRRAAALEPAYGMGAIDDFFIAYEGGRPAAAGGSFDRAQAAFDRAVAASRGRRAAPYVAFAETVAVGRQDRDSFDAMLQKALAVDVDAEPAQRLANVIAQRRARWLLARTDRLFVE